ncbi:hypothetical protein WICPIJ_002200 [Wickerhamomyces pijperi]|uniref:Spindle pole body-associated protein Vik1/Cik1 microtubule binding domain-containing protein n=1 Tax=Wickerhamomyces pijperi TaxID=599730 RepID=A0A9P8QA57_WICPI|nr:hypothetical protein WICPIJ_002200 [Wickerhamomyces pijperi]
MNNNRLPITSTRPEKIRRVLSDLNGQEIHSPHHHTHKLKEPTQNMLQAPPKIASFTSLSQNEQRKSKLPVFTMSKAKREELRAMISGAQSEAIGSASEAAAAARSRSKENNPNYSMQDPEAIKIRKEIEMKLQRMIEKEQESLHDLENFIRDSRADCQNLSKKMSMLEVAIRTAKNQHHQNESTIATLDDKLYLQTQKINSTKIHEAKMSTFKIQEEQNIIMRELDDMKLLLEEQLKHAENYKDEESDKEMIRMEEEMVQLGYTLKILDDSNQDRLKKHKAELESKFQVYIKEQELKNEQLTKNYETKTVELDKIRDKLEHVRAQMKGLDSALLRVQDEIKEVEYLKQNSLSIESHLLQEIERLKLEEGKRQAYLEKTQDQYNDADNHYQMTMHRYTKEQTIRRKIENSIEELESKLRVYARILGNDIKSNRISFEFDHELHQSLTVPGTDPFVVNKVIPLHSSNHDTYKELEVFIQKNITNAINTSVVVVGFETPYFIEDLIDEVKNLLESKFTELKIKYHVETLNHLTTFAIKLERNGRPYETRLNIMNLTSSTANALKDTLQSIVSTLSKVQNCELSRETDINANLPSMEMLHRLYSGSKCLSLLTVKDDQAVDDVNIKILEIGNIISRIEALPLKRMYAAGRET